MISKSQCYEYVNTRKSFVSSYNANISFLSNIISSKIDSLSLHSLIDYSITVFHVYSTVHNTIHFSYSV